MRIEIVRTFWAVILPLAVWLGPQSVNPVAAACTYSISPTNRVHGYGATTNSVSVTTVSGCAWTVANTNNWISILSPTNGLGPGSVSYAVDANFSLNWRTGVVMIADQFLTLSQQPTPCTYSISPTNRVHGYGATTNSVSLTTASGCAWTVVNTNSWITILSPTNGLGSSSVSYAVDANLSVNGRTGVVMIADQLFTLSQQSTPCTYSISPINRVHGYGATTNSVSLTTGGGCAWTVVNTNSWITILSGASGTGGGIVTYAVDANPNPVDRTAVVAIADQTFTILQRAVVCAYNISPTNRVHGFADATNFVGLTTSSGCSWTVVNTNDWITIASPTNGFGSATVNYTVDANFNPTDRAGVVMIADQVFNLSQRGYTNSPFAFRAFGSPAQGQLKLTLMGIPVGVWELQQSPDLVQWQKISNLTNTMGVVEYTDTIPIGANPRFYRAVLPPP